jgi:hypothetical protein
LNDCFGTPRKKDEVKAAALLEERRKALALQDKVRYQWQVAKAKLPQEIERANEILEKHGLLERFACRELPEAGSGNVARCNLALAYSSKPARAEYDITVLAADGRMILLHRATGQRHQKLTVFTASRENWETTLTGLYEDHLKKGRDMGQSVVEPAANIAPAVADRSS